MLFLKKFNEFNELLYYSGQIVQEITQRLIFIQLVFEIPSLPFLCLSNLIWRRILYYWWPCCWVKKAEVEKTQSKWRINKTSEKFPGNWFKVKLEFISFNLIVHQKSCLLLLSLLGWFTEKKISLALSRFRYTILKLLCL